MEKRWYKISELVEAQEFTKMEIIMACLRGELPVYEPDGHLLERVQIPLNGKMWPFLFGGYQLNNGAISFQLPFT